MKKIKATLTPEQIQYLKNQTFSDNKPGTLLKDFSTLLDFIGSTGIPVSGKNHLIAIKLLPQLNQLMSIPLDVKLKRPQQKSFSHINGLYLLLRASGLTQIALEKKETKLLLDNKVLSDWASLNPTERYFALFHAWLRIPSQSCHPFQTNAATHSILKLPLIPVNVATLWW